MRTSIRLEPGHKCHRWTVVAFSHRDDAGVPRYLCRCDCGTERVISGYEISRGKAKSCGCLRREHAARIGHATAIRRDLTGQIFGRLTVVANAPVPGGRKDRWLCRCECGRETLVFTGSLTSGNTRSCGCMKLAGAIAASETHGHARKGRRTRAYRIWCSMWTRCTNPNAINYQYYGGRGIKVCERWKSFEDFLADMGEIPAPLTIDRRDNDGDYCPENCRLATRKEQVANQRKRVKIC